jgi:hypothetical protein
MKNISGQYQDLLEGKMTQAQFLRNARMMFPSFVTNHNSFDDSVRILKQKGMLNEGDAVKGTPDKEPTYESPTPDVKTKYKKVEQSPEVAEQDGIYPATTLTDIPKVKANKKVKNESDGLEPIKDNDTKNKMKKIKVVKEGIHDRDITSAPHTNIKTPPKGVGDYDPKERAASLARLKNMGPKTDEKLKENRDETPKNKIVAQWMGPDFYLAKKKESEWNDKDIDLYNRLEKMVTNTGQVPDVGQFNQINERSFDDIFADFVETDDDTEIKAYLKSKGKEAISKIKAELPNIPDRIRKALAKLTKTELDEARSKNNNKKESVLESLVTKILKEELAKKSAK